MLDHQIAVHIAVHHAKAYARDHNPRHLDLIEDLNQTVSSPHSWLTDTIARLGRHNALAANFDPHMVETCLRLYRERHTA